MEEIFVLVNLKGVFNVYVGVIFSPLVFKLKSSKSQKRDFASHYGMKDFGEGNVILGIKIIICRHGLALSQ